MMTAWSWVWSIHPTGKRDIHPQLSLCRHIIRRLIFQVMYKKPEVIDTLKPDEQQAFRDLLGLLEENSTNTGRVPASVCRIWTFSSLSWIMVYLPPCSGRRQRPTASWNLAVSIRHTSKTGCL
ncbi:uncharacterized protein ACNLHF_012241 [Anomaloglossus baeobatrachus]